jgi:hypothetical protein
MTENEFKKYVSLYSSQALWKRIYSHVYHFRLRRRIKKALKDITISERQPVWDIGICEKTK